MRKIVSWLHRYLGLTLSFLLFLSACTGALITFSSEIDGALNPSLRKVEPQNLSVSIDALIEKGSTAWPSHPIRLIAFPADSHDAVEVWYRGSRTRTYVNPFSGQILGLRDTHDSLMGTLVDLHINLFAGDAGRLVIGWLGLASLPLILLGIWLWWPKRSRWGQAFKIKWEGAAVRIWLDTHKLVGVTTSVFLLTVATTGGALALYDSVTEPLLIAVTGEGTTSLPPLSSPSMGTAASLDNIASQARAIFPEGRLTRIVMPSSAKGSVAVRMRLPGEIHQLGRTFIYFDQYDGKLLRTDNVLEANAATRLYSWLYPLHTGFYGGTVTRSLNILLGLSLAMLALSGTWIWMRNNIAKARAQAGKRRIVQINRMP